MTPELKPATTSLLIQIDRELFAKIKPPAGQRYENSHWRLGNHLLRYYQLIRSAALATKIS